MSKKTVLVEFLPGNGESYFLPVKYIAEFARDENGLCAFCNGDPCAENSPKDSPIGKYFSDNQWAESCPFCNGRPS